MAITTDTLNALTDQTWVEKRVIDHIMRGTPLLQRLRSRMRKQGGTAIKWDIEYARLGGGSRAKGGAMTLTTPEIITRATRPWRYYYVPVQLYQEDIEQNETDPLAVAGYLNSYTRNALATMGEKHLSPDLFKAQSGTNLDSVTDAVSDSASYGGLLKADIPSWQSVVAEATYSATPDTCVSPSIGNFRRMIRTIHAVSGKKPNLIVTSPDVWDVLADQIEVNDNVSALRAGSDIVRWGFDTFFISGVPVVDDMDFAAQQCTDFDGTGGSRSATGGHQALFLNTDFLFMYYMAGRAFTWDKLGWVSSKDNTDYINKVHFWGNIATTSRRVHGRLYGIDPTQDPADYTKVSISTTPFATV